jgi:hypothetical protein
MTQPAHDPRIKQLIILSCPNRIVNLVLANSIEENEKIAALIGSIETFQGIMQRSAAIRQYGKVCSDSPAPRSMYVCGVLHWILTERDKLTPLILQGAEGRNEIDELLRGTEFSDGPPACVEPFQESLQILERLSLQFESRKASLWIVVSLLKDSNIKLLGNHVKGVSQFNRIRNLLFDLTRRVIG